MKSINELLTQVKDDLETDIPALLTAAGLGALAIYETSQSRDAKTNGLFVYHDNSSFQYDRNYCAIIIQLQLNGLEAITAAEYADIISNYMIRYDAKRVEAVMIDSLTVDTWPPDKNQTTFVYLELAFVEPLDSCDGQF